MRNHRHHRGYVMMVVIVMGVILASIAAILLYATSRDRLEGRQQAASVRAVYASEAAVAVGVENLRAELERNTTPDLAAVRAATLANAKAALPDVDFPTLTVNYYDAITNSTQSTPFGSSTLSTITSGVNAGLRAQQTPIQVFAVSNVDNATASVADAIRIDLIPVFQFAMFFDGDFEMQNPAPITVSGRVHTNGNFYISGGTATAFQGNVSVAKTFRAHAAYDSTYKVSVASIVKADGNPLNIATGFPYGSDPFTGTAQANEIKKWGGTVSDSSTGAQPLSIPLRLSSASTCTANAQCGAGRSCVRVRATDENGVCTDDVVSRPDKCGTTSTTASFAQSLAVELIRRPAADYATSGVNAPYADVALLDGSGRPRTSPYSVEFGVRPAMTARTSADMIKVDVPRSVPLMTSTVADDDKGAVLDRMYWKADVRIIDGIWYRKDSTVPVFDPERDAYTPTELAPSTTDWKHLFARTIRYSWWWDGRENRVYCKDTTGKNENCVTDNNVYQRGGQIRSADFDMAAFMALLEDATAKNKLFPAGVPESGVIIYMSETYDPTFEDANTKLGRTPNVRNFLNFPVMHNDLVRPLLMTTATRKSPARNSLTTGARPPNPYEVGWLPERLWGRQAPTNFESLTRTNSALTDILQVAGYTDPVLTSDFLSPCLVPGTDYTSSAAVRPASRPTTFATPAFAPPCIQAGATPLGPENAVRIVRATSVPDGGLTFVTDNRLYLHGDINVRRNSTVKTGNNSFDSFQDIPGSVALMADSLTIQSSRFSDREYQNDAYDHTARLPTGYTNRSWSGATGTSGVTPYSAPATVGEASTTMCNGADTNRLPYTTFVNASLLMGDVPPCINAGTGMGRTGGGVNNFPRFVENWNGDVPLTINGSIVGLFRSERGNARFQDSAYASGGFTRTRTGNGYPNTASACIYYPPKRNWSFDQTLLDAIENLPPGTPRVVATDRLRWVRR